MAAHNRLVGGSSPSSPTTQSHTNRDFPGVVQMARNWWVFARGFVSADDQLNVTAFSASLSLPRKLPFPGNRDQQCGDSFEMGCLPRQINRSARLAIRSTITICNKDPDV
jgi:hypothetical protein